MALMLGRLYDALRAGGVPPDKAGEAAAEVASYERRITDLRRDVRVLQFLLGAVFVLLSLCWLLALPQLP